MNKENLKKELESKETEFRKLSVEYNSTPNNKIHLPQSKKIGEYLEILKREINELKKKINEN
jgi:hypothetical protein